MGILPQEWKIKWKRRWNMKWQPQVPSKKCMEICGLYGGNTQGMENQLGKKVEKEMEAGSV